MRLTEEEYAALLQQGNVREVGAHQGESAPSEPTMKRGALAYLPPASLPSDMLELPFMEEIRKLAQASGWLCYHTYTSRKSAVGFPDLWLVRQHLLVAELKTNERSSQPTQEQTEWLYALEYAGIETYLWRPRDWPTIVERLT